MLSDTERDLILTCAEKYGATALYLFGSTLQSDQSIDIDLGVEGVAPELFFRFYGELLRLLVKPIDLVDLSHQSLFNDLVEERGIKIYG